MISGGNKSKHAAEVAYRMANIFSYKEKIDHAIALYQRAIRLEPLYVPAYLELEALLKRLGRFEECIQLYRTAAESAPHENLFATRLQALLCSSARVESPQREDRPVPIRSLQDDRRCRAHIALYADCAGISGAEQANHMIAMGLHAAGYRVTFIQPQARHYLIQERTQNGIVHVWIESDNIYRGSGFFPSLSNTDEGHSVLGRIRPDLVLFCDGCPVSNLGAKQAAKDLGIPFAALVHCATREWAAFFSKYLPTLRTLYHSARQVIAVSHDNLTLLRDCFGLPPHLGTVVHNGVSVTYFEKVNHHSRRMVRKDLDIPDNAIVCLTVARMEPVKGYQFLIKAIRELRSRPVGTRLHYIWIGSGSMEPRMRAMLDQIGTEGNIHFISTTQEVPRYLDASDIFVLPSMFEGMPISIMEAMAKGLPVVATAVSGTSEELGTTGILLPDPKVDPVQTITGLTDALEKLATDDSLRDTMGAECRRRAEKLFTRERTVANYLELIETLLVMRSVTSTN